MHVVTEQRQASVPVTRERSWEREPITDANRACALDGPDITEADYELTLKAERAVVNTETVRSSGSDSVRRPSPSRRPSAVRSARSRSSSTLPIPPSAPRAPRVGVAPDIVEIGGGSLRRMRRRGNRGPSVVNTVRTTAQEGPVFMSTLDKPATVTGKGSQGREPAGRHAARAVSWFRPAGVGHRRSL